MRRTLLCVLGADLGTSTIESSLCSGGQACELPATSASDGTTVGSSVAGEEGVSGGGVSVVSSEDVVEGI